MKQTGSKRHIFSVTTWKKRRRTACLFFLVAGIIFVCMLKSESLGRQFMRKTIMITAHRGASYGAPENTRASIELAIAEQADYVEIDVRMTADKVPVLMHDRALFRTTGVVNDIDKVTYEEVSYYDAGAGYAKEFVGEQVPSLQEVLEEYGGKIKFNIELKEEENRELAESVVTLIERYGLVDRCVVTSAFYEQLEYVKKENKSIRTGYILSLVYGEIFHCDAADFFSIKWNYITEQLVKGAHKSGKEVHAWTVNRKHEIKQMQELNVDNIITDKPAYVRELIQ